MSLRRKTDVMLAIGVLVVLELLLLLLWWLFR